MLTPLILLACGQDPVSPPGETDGKPDADVDTDVDADADTDTDADTDGPPGGGVAWSAHLVDGTLLNPRGLTVGDFTGDGRLDILVSAGGDVELDVDGGQVALYTQGPDLATWTRTDLLLAEEGIEFPNTPIAADLDADTDLDFVLPAGNYLCTTIPLVGPCGSLSWFEQTGGGWTRRTFLDGDDRFYQGGALADIDQDGTLDLVVGGERVFAGYSDAQTHWYRGVGSQARFEVTERVIGIGGGGRPIVLDIDEDGMDDVAVAEVAVEGETAVWFERTTDPNGAAPAGVWTRRVLDASNGPGWMVQAADLDGDGDPSLVMTNHVNAADGDPYVEGVYRLDPVNPYEPWTPTRLSDGIAADPSLVGSANAGPGDFGIGDLDGDGDLDIAVAGDGDPTVYVLVQDDGGLFTTLPLYEELPEALGMAVADLDGDGDLEVVVAGAANDVILVLERQ